MQSNKNAFPHTGRRTLALALLITPFASNAAIAQWSTDPDVNNLLKNNIYLEDKDNPVLKKSAFVESARGCLYFYLDSKGLSVRRISSTGYYQGTPAVVDSGGAKEVVAVPNGNLGAVVAYVKNDRIYAAVVDIGGNVKMAPTLVSSGFCLERPAICEDGLGGAIMSWHQYDSSGQRILVKRIRRVTATSWTPIWGGAVGTLMATVKSGALSSVRIAELTVPYGAAVAWLYKDGGNVVRAKTLRVNSSGQANPSNAVNVTTLADSKMELKIASDGSRNAFYAMFHMSGVRKLVTQRIDASGTKWSASGNVTFVGTAAQQIGSSTDPFDIAAIGDGRAAVVVNRFLQFRTEQVHGAVLAASNGAVQSNFPVSSQTYENRQPDLLVDNSGKETVLIVAWQKYTTHSIAGFIYGQRLLLDGTPTWNLGNEMLISSRHYSVYNPLLTARGDCSYFVSFPDWPKSTQRQGLVQVVTHDESTGTGFLGEGRCQKAGPITSMGFDRGLGGLVVNYGTGSGTGNGTGSGSGTMVHSPGSSSWRLGKFGASLLRGSRNDLTTDYAYVDSGFQGKIQGDFTVHFWLKQRHAPGTGLSYVFGGLNGPDDFRCFSNGSAGKTLWIRGLNGRDRIEMPTVGSDFQTRARAAAGVFVTVVVATQTGKTTAQWYLDGRLHGAAQTLTLPPNVKAGTKSLMIGKRDSNLSSSVWDIDEFRLYDRAATSAEIQQWTAGPMAKFGYLGTGRNLTLRTSGGRPTIGNQNYTHILSATPAAPTNCLFVVGVRRAQPFDIGMIFPNLAGHQWYASFDVEMMVRTGANGYAAIPTRIPNSATLAGLHIDLQALGFQGATPSVSNAVTGAIELR